MSEILADAGIAHTVCVATEYGEIVMREQTESTKAMQTAGQPIVNLHCGRMDREQMQKFLHDEGYEIVVDATHPYAVEATKNIRAAANAAGVEYHRLLRAASTLPAALPSTR